MNECACELSGFCKVRNVTLKPTLQMLCRENPHRIDLFLNPKPPEEKTPKKNVRRSGSPCSRKAERAVANGVGTKILEAFEKEAGTRLSCGQCKTWVLALNKRSSHDHEEIVAYMSSQFPWPHEWRLANTKRRDRISEVISPIVPRPVDTSVPANYFAGRLVAVTSLNPNPTRWDRQKKCLKSWVRHGLPVITVNTQSELDQLSLPEGVTGVACEKLTQHYDRQTQFVSSLAAAGRETGVPFMLINSDIEISGNVAALDIALLHPDRLTIGIRHNHQAGQNLRNAKPEASGLDVFLMTPDMAATIPEAPFGIGKPVWDYWMPQHFRSLGVEFHWIREPLFFHERHELGWSRKEWKIGCDFLGETYDVHLGYGSSEFRRSLDKPLKKA